MPRTPEQYEEIRNEKRQLIIDVALKLFANHGYSSTSISQIAENANISKGLLYNYFKSKEELLNAIISKTIAEMMSMIDPNNDNIISDEEALDFFDLFFSSMRNNTVEMKNYFQLTFQPEVLNLLTEGYTTKRDSRYAEMFINFFEKRSPKNARLKILNLINTLKGFSMQYVFAPEFFSDELVDAYKEYLKDIFVRGINE